MFLSGMFSLSSSPSSSDDDGKKFKFTSLSCRCGSFSVGPVVGVDMPPKIEFEIGGGGGEIRAVSAALHTPNWGPRCHRGPNFSPVTTYPPKESFDPSKFKYEAL